MDLRVVRSASASVLCGGSHSNSAFRQALGRVCVCVVELSKTAVCVFFGSPGCFAVSDCGTACFTRVNLRLRRFFTCV